MKQLKFKTTLCLILLCFLSIKIFHLIFQKGISWDSAVYIGMGKHIFSLGKTGLWEPARPLVWPFILGFIWKINLDPMIWGRILELMFSLGCIYITYLIGKETFNENIALLSSILLAFSPTFLFYSSTLLTGIPSTFFALLSVYFFIKERYALTGFLIGISFATRFLQLLTLLPILFILVLYKKRKLQKTIKLACGISIVIIPYLIINFLLYKNPIHPLLLQSFMAKYTGWIFHQPPSFYFIRLLKENLLILFAIIGTIAILTKKDYKKTTILSIFLLFLAFFTLIAHKEMRFTIVFLPYLYLITSYGIFKSLSSINKKKITYTVITIIGIIWLTQQTIQITTPQYQEYPEFGNYLEKDEVKNNIWVTNPIFIVNSNKKADELIYYPLYNSKKIGLLKEKLPKAEHILIDTCDILPCPPEDVDCNEKTTEFLNTIKKDFQTFHYKKERNCEEFIFTTISSP